MRRVLANSLRLLPALAFPPCFLFALSGGLSDVTRLPQFEYRPGYTTFEFVFVFVQSAAFAGVFTGFLVARDYESGFAHHILLAASARSGILAGYILGSALRWLPMASVVTAAAIVARLRVDGDAADLCGFVALGLLTNVVAALWSCGIAVRVRVQQAGMLTQMSVLVFLFVTPVYVPLRLLSGWIRKAAELNPTTSVLQAGRGLIAGAPVELPFAFGLLLALAFVLSLWASRGLDACTRPR